MRKFPYICSNEKNRSLHFSNRHEPASRIFIAYAQEDAPLLLKLRLLTADIILLLVSPDFIDSDYIWNTELKIAMERHERGEASIVPIILRPCQWHDMPFGRLQALPTGARPVTE